MEIQMLQKKAKPVISSGKKPHGRTYEGQRANVQSVLHANRIQPKLKVGHPNDKYEQEADRVAEQVMRMPAPQSSSSASGSLLTNSAKPSGIQRACAACAKDDELIQTKTSGSIAPEVTSAIGAGIQSLQGGGQSLSKSERGFFEPRIGADFSHVRVHNDAHAANIAQSINARAFTVGQHVVFGAGEYSPNTSTGKKLFAHELMHVVQQNGTSSQIQCAFRPWPFNGRVINNSSQAVHVWSDDGGNYEILPNSSSDRFTEDVDYIQDRHGRWYKIGVNTVTVDSYGEITGYSCLALRAGGPCLPGDRFPPENEASGSGAQRV